jgi:hypothetical protein
MDLTCDSLFFDPEQALRCARQRRPARAWGRSSAVQLCYYTGRHQLPVVLDNLIFVPKSDFVPWLSATRLRLPESVTFPDPPPPATVARAFESFLERALLEVKAGRLRRVQELGAAIAALPPPLAHPPWRITVHTSLFSEVLQFCARGLVQALVDQGQDARLVIEHEEREFWDNTHHLEQILEQRPHLVVFIDYHHPEFLAPWMVQVVWWQDLMPDLTSHRPLPWRANDLVYSLDRAMFAPHLSACGLPPERQRTQHFCIDTAIYRPDAGVVRRPRTVVFVGSAYAPALARLPAAAQAACQDLAVQVEAGHLPTLAEVAATVPEGLTQPQLYDLLSFLVRDLPVRWLCRLDGWTVEVYGSGWDQDPEVSPCHRGSVPPGPELARLYASASHALSLHPCIINHQRLAEIACCGAIPVIYDCRALAEPPHWDERALFFRSRQGLRACLEQPLAADPQAFASHFDYRHFAQRILADATPHLTRISA